VLARKQGKKGRRKWRKGKKKNNEITFGPQAEAPYLMTIFFLWELLNLNVGISTI
jgi:hypothetical protein